MEILLFYNQNCNECQQVLSFLSRFLSGHPEVSVQYHDIFNSPDNQLLFQRYNERYDRPLSPVPAIFVGDRELVGYEEIRTGLGDAVLAA